MEKAYLHVKNELRFVIGHWQWDEVLTLDKLRLNYIIEKKTQWIREFIKGRPYLWLAMKTIKHGNEDEYRKMVSYLLQNGQPNAFELQEYGEMNCDRNLMLLLIHGRTGMGPLLRRVVHGAYLAEELGCIPVVEFVKDTTLYQEKEEYLGTSNVFDYYFEQPGGISLKEAYQSKHVFICHDYNFAMGADKLCKQKGPFNENYTIDEDYIEKAGKVAGRNLRLNESAQHIISTSRSRIWPHGEARILGVHIRGTDFRLHWEHHPNALSPEDFFQTIDEALEHGFTHIFLATDDSGYVRQFQDKYGQKLIYYHDVHREEGTQNIAFVQTHREHDHYLNGLEVIRDIYTLAACDGLVAGLSHVSITARLVKAGNGKGYEYQQILNKGLYHSAK